MSSDRHPFHEFFTMVLLVLGLFALAMAQNTRSRSNAPPANPLGQILSGQGRAKISQAVTLSQVAIQNITQNDILWVGTSPSNSVLVLLQPSVNPIDAHGNPAPIAVGNQVRVTGHVLRAPSRQQLQGWGVAPEAAARVQRQGVVLQAVTLEVTHRNR